MDAITTPVSPATVLVEAMANGDPLAAAMELALEQVLGAGLPMRTDEETTTAAFLGALIANLTWTTQLCDRNQDAVRQASWSVHRKSQGEGQTESRTGVDFGLAIKHSETDVRLALFQAKRGHRDAAHRFYVDVRRPVKIVDGTPTTQIEQLVHTGLNISKHDKRKLLSEFVDAIPSKFSALRALDWVHYLGFYARSFRAVALKHCGEAFVEERVRERSLSYNDIELTENNSVPLLTLLRSGLQKMPRRSKGWISLTQADLTKCLPDLVPIMDVYVVDEGSSDWPLQLLMKPASNLQDRELNRQALASERAALRSKVATQAQQAITKTSKLRLKK